MEQVLKIKHLSKAFGSNQVLKDIDFTVNKGDVISIIGASGSGKSTLLRCINLLETPTAGEIWYNGKNVAARKVKAHEYRSHVGMGLLSVLTQRGSAGSECIGFIVFIGCWCANCYTVREIRLA